MTDACSWNLYGHYWYRPAVNVNAVTYVFFVNRVYSQYCNCQQLLVLKRIHVLSWSCNYVRLVNIIIIKPTWPGVSDTVIQHALPKTGYGISRVQNDDKQQRRQTSNTWNICGVIEYTCYCGIIRVERCRCLLGINHSSVHTSIWEVRTYKSDE